VTIVVNTSLFAIANSINEDISLVLKYIMSIIIKIQKSKVFRLYLISKYLASITIHISSLAGDISKVSGVVSIYQLSNNICLASALVIAFIQCIPQRANNSSI